MAERRVKKSHPDFKKLFDLSEKIAVAKNPQRWFNASRAVESGQLPRSERHAIINTLEDKMYDELYGGRFRDYLNGKGNK